MFVPLYHSGRGSKSFSNFTGLRSQHSVDEDHGKKLDAMVDEVLRDLGIPHRKRRAAMTSRR